MEAEGGRVIGKGAAVGEAGAKDVVDVVVVGKAVDASVVADAAVDAAVDAADVQVDVGVGVGDVDVNVVVVAGAAAGDDVESDERAE